MADDGCETGEGCLGGGPGLVDDIAFRGGILCVCGIVLEEYEMHGCGVNMRGGGLQWMVISSWIYIDVWVIGVAGVEDRSEWREVVVVGLDVQLFGVGKGLNVRKNFGRGGF